MTDDKASQALEVLDKKSRGYRNRERSRYQLEHFVIGQHDTPEMRYHQIVLEAQSLIYKIKWTELQQEKSRIEIERLLASDDEIDHLTAQQNQMNLWLSEINLAGAKDELADLYEISKDYRDYTREDIEANQADYWERRLTRQAETDRLSAQQGISSGNLASMIQANLVRKELSQ